MNLGRNRSDNIEEFKNNTGMIHSMKILVSHDFTDVKRDKGKILVHICGTECYDAIMVMQLRSNNAHFCPARMRCQEGAERSESRHTQIITSKLHMTVTLFTKI